MIWGVSFALHEHAVIDQRSGRTMNPNLAEYHVPVNADMPSIEAILVEERDVHVNALGIKGVGEIGITGTAGAVANAVWHATGVRVRQLPDHAGPADRSVAWRGRHWPALKSCCGECRCVSAGNRDVLAMIGQEQRRRLAFISAAFVNAAGCDRAEKAVGPGISRCRGLAVARPATQRASARPGN